MLRFFSSGTRSKSREMPIYKSNPSKYAKKLTEEQDRAFNDKLISELC